ncbi:MAG: hypothetical protein A2Z47_11140 [Thermodesulfovibrio sp. RBG_19FT_COMBO_42_12]|nr:MAG: hypothetical protein A2Z47_11140 [Thermodesulfovibrio sp. RBG_19FT_COMBO_42_12]
MDIHSMKTLGWSQELIDAVNALKDIIDEGAVKEPSLKGLDAYKIEQVSSASINISHYLPVGQTYIHFSTEED